MTPRGHIGSLLALAAALAALAAACGAKPPAGPEDWLHRTTEERSAEMWERLGTSPRWIRVSGAVLRFVEAGPGDGAPALMFVHGHGGSMGDFGPVAARLAGDHRIVAADLPGFGGSVQDGDDYSLTRYVSVLAELAGRMELPRVHLVCHSLGGQICMAAALSREPFVAGMTLVDSAGIQDPQEFVQRISKRLGGINTGKVTTARGRSMFDVAVSDGPLASRVMSRSPAVLAALSSFDRSYRREVRRIAQPTLIVWGENDPIFPLADGVTLKDNIAGSEMRVVYGAGHAPQLSHPEPVARWIAGHVAAVEERSR
jgi:4,5:9,10-diseco-3-hydroxy-5,9,17-trioxoandrosta-1(10),2-diene-4-oate hydrolase